jgi:Flp pilus assembly protein TadG
MEYRPWLRRMARKVAGTTLIHTASRRFCRKTGGNLTVFALILFVGMAMIGGLAVDIMRYEAVRTNLQNTLDRSTLAAASLTQELDAEGVVYDYFEKAGLSQYLTSVEVDEGMNYRQVTADATAATNPFFLHMMGIEQMDADGHSQAEQRVTNVEIVLVLDVSGSMGSNSRLTNLKTAASDFIDTVLGSDPDGKISIALVPFNGQVNLGATLSAKYNLQYDPAVAGVECVDLPSSAYSSTALSTSTAMPMTADADTYSTTYQTTSFVSATDSSYAVPNGANKWCPPSTVNIVRLPSKSASELKGYINGLTAIGATSINAGMRWGVAMMDPGSRTMFNQFISAGQISSDFTDRPYDYDADDVMKVVVLMTDGENFAEERVNSAYKTGLSPIYYDTSGKVYSIYHAGYSGTNKYYSPNNGSWYANARGTTTSSYQTCTGSGKSKVCTTTTVVEAGTSVQLTWPEVWSRFRLSYVAWQFYARALGTSSSTRSTQYNNAMAAFRTQTDTDDMDSQLQQICTLAKNQNVIVYGIAFEATTNGQTQISQCATSAAHYFSASGIQIKTAFRTIANNISQLRLTQ